MSQQLTRRQLGAMALTGIGTTFLLAACGTSATPGGAATKAATADAYKKATLTFEWWTNPVRSAYTSKILTNYSEAHPAITINQAPGEWATYWTKLSTQIAGQTEPDIIQMDQAYIAEYGGRGALLDLNKVGTIDTTPLKSTLSEGVLGGKLYGIPTGNNAYAYGANKTLFEKAGIDLPDDTTWTWDDFNELCTKLAKASGGAFAGGEMGGVNDLQVWLQGHGELLFTNKGAGYKMKTLTGWFQQLKDFFASGGSVDNSTWVNDTTASVQQSSFGTSKVAIFGMWSNQITAYQAANTGDCVLLRPPSSTGKSTDAGMYYKPSMYWSIGSQTKYPAQAGALINEFLNSTDAAKLQLAERGVPASAKVLEVVKPLLSKYDQLAITYMNDIKSEIKVVPPIPPKGTSTTATLVTNAVEDVMYGRSTPAQAASSFDSQLKGLIAAAGS